MSDAFRSQLEAAEEKVRRAGEEIATLRDEVTKLETRLSPTQKPRNLWLGGVIIALLSATGAGATVALREARERKELEEDRHAAVREATRLLELRVACERERIAEKAKCESDLEALRPKAPAPADVLKACNCEPGDPLCSCAFDKAAAATALGKVELHECATQPEPRVLHATFMFIPTGEPSVVTIDDGSERLTESERSCVARTLRKVRVPGFSGAPVRVGKTYTLNK